MEIELGADAPAQRPAALELLVGEHASNPLHGG